MCWIFTFWYSLWSVWLRLQTDVYSHSHAFTSQAGDRWSKYPRLTHNRCRRIRPETGSHWRWITETSSLTTGSAIDMQQPNPRVFIAALIRAGMLRQRLINTALELNQVSWWWSLKRTARGCKNKAARQTACTHRFLKMCDYLDFSLQRVVNAGLDWQTQRLGFWLHILQVDAGARNAAHKSKNMRYGNKWKKNKL